MDHRTPVLVAGDGWLGFSAAVPDAPDLRQLQPAQITRPRRRRLDTLVARSLALLADWLASAQRDGQAPYVSVSGGKDSAVTWHLARRVDRTIPGVYARDAEPALPDLEQLFRWWRGHGADLREFVWASRFALYRAHGFNNQKLNGIFDRTFREQTAAMGLGAQACGYRADENVGRSIHRAVHGPLRQDRFGRWRCDPLLDWSVHDVWAYHALHGMPYPKLYDVDDGQPRAHRRVDSLWGTATRQFGRFVRLQRHYPEHYRLFAAAFPELRTDT